MATAELANAGAVPAEHRRASAGLWSDAAYRLRHDPTTLMALLVLGLLVAISLLADVLAENVFHRTLSQVSILDNYTPPTRDDPALWLGSDDLGRSQIVRLIYGGRVSLAIGTFGAVVSMVIGVGRDLRRVFPGLVGRHRPMDREHAGEQSRRCSCCSSSPRSFS